MNLIDHKRAKNFVEGLYYGVIDLCSKAGTLTPYARRVLRFAALPYCFFYEVDWSKCPRSKVGVLYDMLYVFFVLKYYPDNYYNCRLWEVDRELWKFFYGSIYDPYQRKKFRMRIYSRDNVLLFENKLICYELCKAAGFPQPRQYGAIYPDEPFRSAISRFLKESRGQKVIIKPLYGAGGKGIVVAYLDGQRVMVKKKDVICPLEQFNLNQPAVLQEYLSQHHVMAKFSHSVNTVRLATLLKKDQSDVLLVGACARFGAGDSDVDNISSGGIGLGIDVDTGIVLGCGRDFNGGSHLSHPTSGHSFQGLMIPHWEKVVELAKAVQFHFKYHRMLGVDIAIQEEGPVLIELNAEQDVAGLEMNYGPILLREEVLLEFARYDLLVNKPSKEAARAASAGSHHPAAGAAAGPRSGCGGVRRGGVNCHICDPRHRT